MIFFTASNTNNTSLKFYLLFIFLFINALVHAQNYNAQLIPHRIFVGDPAVLIISLPAASGAGLQTITLTNLSDDFPYHPDIDFHRITLERRVTDSRVLIEFTAFVPGTLEFPVIEIGGEYFYGLSVTVNSIIDSRQPLVLSGAASTLSMPGTAALLYGTLIGIVFFILLTVWFFIKGRKLIQVWIDKWNRWRLFSSIRNMEKRFYREVVKGGDKRLILDKLSEQFRIFLSVLSGHNCRAMTASEFATMEPATLHHFFNTCDELRFSGGNIDSENVLQLLTELRNFIDIFEDNYNSSEVSN
ncbi:MAG: hypothetical protein LBU66_00660 [Treponema sp.]|jgi:hypothetical protein|nr:hypothetical protein [Treponema sp.]